MEGESMNKIALILSVLALVIGSLAYWRSGGKEDVITARRALEERIQSLQTKQEELTENAKAATREAYESLQVRMERVAKGLAEIRENAATGLKAQIDSASRDIEALQSQVAQGLKALKDLTVAPGRQAEEALAKGVGRLEARLDTLEAKFFINRALAAAEENQFDRAEERLREAAASIKEAQRKLDGDTAHDAEFHAVNLALREAVTAVKSRASDVRARIDKIVTESDALVASLESKVRVPEISALPTTRQ
jgi:chromosome segregation ATPase